MMEERATFADIPDEMIFEGEIDPSWEWFTLVDWFQGKRITLTAVRDGEGQLIITDYQIEGE